MDTVNGGTNGAPATNGDANGHSAPSNDDASAPFSVKAGLAQMLKGGVIMDVVNAEQVTRPPPATYPAPAMPRLTPPRLDRPG